MIATLDPLGLERPQPLELDLARYGFAPNDVERQVSTTSNAGADVCTPRQVWQRLKQTYCRSIGAQFMHIDDPLIRDWLCERMESTENRLALPREVQVRILTRLTDAEIFEEFVRKKYIGAKTFSLEGAESLIPLLDLAIEKASRQGVDEIVIGMAHRGRLNVLANILGKRPIDSSFPMLQSQSSRIHPSGGAGPDAGQAGSNGRPRPPERHGAADPRRCRVRRRRIVQETLNLSQLPAYEVGGALHVIVNNQLGFTTSPREGRSTSYATDVAKTLQTAIFHVNGEDPEAVARVVDLALDFRRRFHRDVVIGMYCYRRWGHNEGDEPSFTVVPFVLRESKPATAGKENLSCPTHSITRTQISRT